MKAKGTYGKNFNQTSLSYKQFTYVDDRGAPIYTNFLLGFFPYKEGAGRNYQRLKMIDEKLANELSTVFYHYHRSGEKINEPLVKGHGYPKYVLEKAYKGYLILREAYKNDECLLQMIKDYRSQYPGFEICDDWAAFFS